jgi:hypothetical protein
MQAISRVIHRFFAARPGTVGPIFATPVLMLTAIARGSVSRSPATSFDQVFSEAVRGRSRCRFLASTRDSFRLCHRAPTRQVKRYNVKAGRNHFTRSIVQCQRAGNGG